MAGLSNSGEYVEKVSMFLREKLALLESSNGKNSPEYKAVSLQYLKQSTETISTGESNRRHWEADMNVQLDEGTELHGMERLYNRTIVVEPTMICASHCRYCLRGNYATFTLTKEELFNIAVYCGSVGKSSGLNEILITGGDPAILPQLLDYFVECLIEQAPNIRIIRIATRLLTHDPSRLGNTFYNILKKRHKDLRFEVATQINHACEFFPETIESIQKIQDCGADIYSQNVLLKGVNDNLETMLDLYTTMRYYNVEPHYLFHCVPLKGMHHFRTKVDKGIDLIKLMVNSGYLSGRAKPMYALMTDIGKVTLYEDTIMGREDGYVVLKSNYSYDERMKWNPSWRLPETASVADDGKLIIRYMDGCDNE